MPTRQKTRDAAARKGNGKVAATSARDLRPDPANANRGSARGHGMLEESITRYGLGRGIVVDKHGVVIGGNKTLEVAVERGLLKTRIVKTRGDELVVTQREDLDLSDPTNPARLLAYADNRVAEVSLDWDLEQIRKDIDAGQDLSAFFLEDELAALLASEAQPKAGLTDPDDVPQERPTGIVAGDLFELGRHRLLCGDSTKPEDAARVLDGQKAELCLTDPPYGIGEQYATYVDTPAALKTLIAGWFPIAQQSADVLLFTPWNKHQWLYPSPTWCLGWFTGGGSGCNPWGFTSWHAVYAYGKDPYLTRGMGSRPDALSKIDTSDVQVGHPSQKPLSVWLWFLERGSVAQGDRVYEPFSGSGTTLIACEQAHRVCCAIELSPGYVQVAIDRFEQFTGSKVQKVGEAVGV